MDEAASVLLAGQALRRAMENLRDMRAGEDLAHYLFHLYLSWALTPERRP